MTKEYTYILTFSCPDKPGVVHAVSTFFVERDINILSSAQFFDEQSGMFFMRVKVSAELKKQPLDAIQKDWGSVANEWQMIANWFDINKKSRIFIMVSKEGHCLNDILYQTSTGKLPIEIVGIGSNHLDLKKVADNYNIPFYHWPLANKDDDKKAEQEQKLKDVVQTLNVDLVVLARYMQILSHDLCEFLENRAINIHHSFLPSFKGAKPYYQAFNRGVKLIGATAHFVTSDLDEGPIIEQDVARVHHGMSVEALTSIGNEIERSVLSRALLYYAEHRILRNQNKTIVFL